MSFLLKNSDTLTQLFSTFSLQEVLIVNQNLHASWHLLVMPPSDLLLAMQKQQVSIEHFLGKKCLALIRFYLSESETQKKVFLSKPLLAKLFSSLPPVEATIFKQQIQKAQKTLQQTNQTLSSLLCSQDIPQQLSTVESVVRFDSYLCNKTVPLSQSRQVDKSYKNCFYYLQSGELQIVEGEQLVDNTMLLYSELSPLQQLQAQALFSRLKSHSKEVDISEQQSVSA